MAGPTRTVLADRALLTALPSKSRCEDSSSRTSSARTSDRDSSRSAAARRASELTRETVRSLFNVEHDRITDFVEFDPAFAIEFTLKSRASHRSPDPVDSLTEAGGVPQPRPLPSCR